MKYAGIGSRTTPQGVLNVMTELSVKIADRNVVLRSGGAKGADTAFEDGVLNPQLTEIFTVSSGTDEQRKRWLGEASLHHPAWNRCSDYAKALHARNMAIVLGADLNDPVDFVACWTPNGEITGGTGQAIRVAQANNIKIYNLYWEANYDALWLWATS